MSEEESDLMGIIRRDASLGDEEVEKPGAFHRGDASLLGIKRELNERRDMFVGEPIG